MVGSFSRGEACEGWECVEDFCIWYVHLFTLLDTLLAFLTYFV